MGNNEIKIRRKILEPEDIGRYRNYAALVHKFKRQKRMRRTVKLFAYSIMVTLVAVLVIVVISFLMVRLERNRQQKKHEANPATVSQVSSPRQIFGA